MENIQGITTQTTVNAPVEKCWKLWITASDIMQWNTPSGEWHTPSAVIDPREGGSFLFRMETKDGRVGFDHGGVYDKMIVHELIAYTGADGRRSIIRFTPHGDTTTITETFEPEATTPLDMQRWFCAAVLDTFKRYAEAG